MFRFIGFIPSASLSAGKHCPSNFALRTFRYKPQARRTMLFQNRISAFTAGFLSAGKHYPSNFALRTFRCKPQAKRTVLFKTDQRIHSRFSFRQSELHLFIKRVGIILIQRLIRPH